MYKRGLAFLLAAVLAFSPVMQVNAAEVNVSETGAQEMPIETPEIAEVEEETATPEVIASAQPEASETPSENPEESATPEETPTKSPEENAEPEESAAPEESWTPEVSATPEEAATPEESAAPEESAMPDVSATPEESMIPDESPSVEPSETPITEEASEETEETEEEPEIDTGLVTLLTEDINLYDDSPDTSGAGWTWVQATKTFTMNGYHSTGKLSLPDGATLVLKKGTENIIDKSANANYGIDAKGNLTITGAGKLIIKYKNRSVINMYGDVTFLETNAQFEQEKTGNCNVFYYNGNSVRIISSNIKMIASSNSGQSKLQMTIEGCNFIGGTPDTNYYYYKENSETGLFEMRFEKSPIYITTQPQKINTLFVGESVGLQINAKSTAGKTLKYQWYTTTNFNDPEAGATKVKDATSKKLTAKPVSRGITYYFCKVSDGSASMNTEVAAVVATNPGMKLCTTSVAATTKSYDNLATQGWKYDATTHTFTLENMDLLVPFSNNVPYVLVPSGVNVVINGINYINYGYGYLEIGKANQVGTVTTISGNGTLYADQVFTGNLASGAEVQFKGGLNLILREFDFYRGPILLDGVSVQVETDIDIGHKLELKNGASLISSDEMELSADLVVGDGCSLTVGDYVRCDGSMSIGKNATVILDGYLDMDATSGTKSRTLQINGTLYVKNIGTSKPIELYSQAENPMTMGEDIRVITPEGALWQKEYTTGYDYCFKSGTASYFKPLLIGSGDMETKSITGSKKISGTAKFGKVLTAGEVTPADAMVSYQWQFSQSATGNYYEITGAKSKTLAVPARYHGYYLRVVIRGMGTYAGEIISDPIGPVVGDPATLSGILCEGGNGETYMPGGRPFDCYSYNYTVNTDKTTKGTVDYVVTTVSEDAKVTFRNITTGFKATGKSASIPVVDGKNEIEIEVKYGTRTTVYYVTNKVSATEYRLYLSSGASASGSILTATWVDGKGQTQTKSTSGSSYAGAYYIPAGTEITITSTAPNGKYPCLYDGPNLVPDVTKPGYPATFIMNGHTTVYLYTSDMLAYPPEDLSAKWQLADGSAQVEVKGLAKGNDQSGYEEIAIKIFDKADRMVGSKLINSSTAPDADGYYRVNVTGLDSTEQYRVEAYYDDLYNSSYPLDKQTATFTLKKRTPVTLDTASDYVVLRPGDKVNVPVLYEGYAGSKVVVDSGYDTAVVSASGTTIKTDASGNNTLQITAAGEGTTYITLRGEDYENNDGMQYVFTTVRVDVSPAEEAESLRLGVKKGTLNLYDDSVLTVPVYQMECGHEIEGAQFEDAALNEKLAIEVVNDRTVKIVPKVPADDGSVDFSKWVKESGRTGTFSSKIVVRYKGTANRESKEKLSITLTAKKPETKVSALSFNSFYTRQAKNLKVTVKGEKVAKIQVDTVKTSATKVACPDWLSLNESAKKVEFNGRTVPANKTTGYIYLKIWPEGYRMPIQTKVKVQVAYTKPKLKVSKSTVSVGKDITKQPAFQIKLVSGNKTKLQDIGIQFVDMMSQVEYMKLSAKKRKEYVNPEIFNTSINSVDKSAGVYKLYFSDTPTNGKVVLDVKVVNGKEPIKVSFNLKVQSAPTLKVNKDTLIMDAMYGNYPYNDDQIVKLTCSASGYIPDYSNLQFKVTMVGDKTQTDYRSNFNLWWDSEKKTLQISRNGDRLEAGKTYKLEVSMLGVPKPAVIKIKVIKSTPPKMKVSKTEVTLNRMQYKGSGKVTFSLPKGYRDGWSVKDIKFIKPDGTEDTDNESLDILWEGNRKIYFQANDLTQKGTYTVKFTGAFYGGAEMKPVAVKVKVVDKFHSLTPQKQTITLNKDLAAYDKASVMMPTDYNYRYVTNPPWTIASVKDANGADATDRLSCRMSGAELRVEAKAGAEYGGVYTVKLLCKFANGVDKSVTVTVKIAQPAPKIALKGKASGSVDLTRPANSTAVITYSGSNWNVNDYSGSQRPVIEWEIYAKKKDKALKVKDGALTDKGLVAKGDSANSLPTLSDSWFKDSYSSYQVGLQINQSSAAWKAGDISPDYTYTIKATVKFPSTGEVVQAAPVTFKVKQGTVKYTQSPKKAILNKLDNQGRSLFTITNKTKNYTDVAKIAKVEVVGNKEVPVSKKLEIVPVYSAGNKITFAVHWKDRKAANVKSGTVKVNIYLEGNDPARKKPNASFKLKVNVK